MAALSISIRADADGGAAAMTTTPSRGDPNNNSGMLGMQFMLLSITALFITIALIYFARSQTSTNWRPIAVPKLLLAQHGPDSDQQCEPGIGAPGVPPEPSRSVCAMAAGDAVSGAGISGFAVAFPP